MYEISGSLDGVAPGRRTVRELHVRRLDGGTGEGLAPLSAFGDLRVLTLEDVCDLDLAPLGELELEQLRLDRVAGVDFEQLGLRDGLVVLSLDNIDDDCRVPKSMRLPPTLHALLFGEWRRGHTGRQVEALIEAVEWLQLSTLKSVRVQVDDVEQLPEIDLGFLRELPELERLWVTGVHHIGSSPSPLEPPFDGLSRKLRHATFEATDPIPTREAVRRYLALPDDVQGVSVRKVTVPAPPPWQLREPLREGGEWHTYGSLAEHAALTSDKTEYDALRTVKGTLRKADPRLLRRLDFDPEANGTGIMARTREDLLAALEILGINPS